MAGYPDRKPPPPYEQVGNSVAYQLLHQYHGDVTARLVDSLYPALKAMELKDPSLVETYTSYLERYDECKREGATPELMFPGDLPTLQVLVDFVVHLCCMPQLTELAVKLCGLWMQLLAILSHSPQNKRALHSQRSCSKILSCMNLSVMATCLSFQVNGWSVLGNVAALPTAPGDKPSLTEPTLTVAFSLVQHQLERHRTNFDLVTAVMHFLAQVASAAKASSLLGNNKGETPATYSVEQGKQVLVLLREHNILRHVMKVPHQLRSDLSFDTDYCTLVKSLIPKRTGGVARVSEATPPPPAKPPRKPQRNDKLRRSTYASGEGLTSIAEKAHKSVKMRHVSDTHPPLDLLAHTVSETELLAHTVSDIELLHSSSQPDLHCTSHSALHSSSAADLHSTSEANPHSPDSRTSDPHASDPHTSSASGSHSSDPHTSVPHTSDPDTVGLNTSTTSILHTCSVAGLNTSNSNSTDLNTSSHHRPEKTAAMEAVNHHGKLSQLHQAHNSSSSSSAQTEPHSLQGAADASTREQHTVSDLNCPTREQHTPSRADASTQEKQTVSDLNCPTREKHTVTTTHAEALESTQANASPTHCTAEHSQPSVDSAGVSQSQSRGEREAVSVRTDHEGEEEVGDKDGDSPRVRIPSVSRTSRYYRHSLKKRGSGQTPEWAGPRDTSQEPLNPAPTSRVGDSPRRDATPSSSSSSPRLLWRQPVSPPQLLGLDDSALFEQSGEHLSSTHTVLEAIASGHADVKETLTGRVELVRRVLRLWGRDKGLQAATNSLQACFSDGESDVVLFTDILSGILKHKCQGSWTLAVCFVLLPALRQLLGREREGLSLQVTAAAVETIVARFSNSIMSCKHPVRRRRLSGHVDRQQQLVCYRELHDIWVAVGNRIKLNSDLEPIAGMFRKLLSQLEPYREELINNS